MTNLHRRAQPARPPQTPIEEVERDQHRLPEDVEEQQVLRREDADDRAGEEQHQPVVGARPLAADPDGVGDRGRQTTTVSPTSQMREAEDADVVGDVQVAEPGSLLVELRAPDVAKSNARRARRSRSRPRRARRASASRPAPSAAAAAARCTSAPPRAGGSGWSRASALIGTEMKTTARTATPPRREGVGAHEAGLERGARRGRARGRVARSPVIEPRDERPLDEARRAPTASSTAGR